MNIYRTQQDIPKHIKKRRSSISKSISKADHKHKYKDCILKYNVSQFYYKSKYCLICGKLRNTEYINKIINEETGKIILKTLTQEEILDMYKGLPVFIVDNYDSKFVKLL